MEVDGSSTSMKSSAGEVWEFGWILEAFGVLCCVIRRFYFETFGHQIVHLLIVF
jgi:hypothetical protein